MELTAIPNAVKASFTASDAVKEAFTEQR